MVLWFQGCTLGCSGCFNPNTHAAEPPWQVPVADLVAQIVAEAESIEGITLSGGKPLQQPEALLELLFTVRAQTTLSVILLSGSTLFEVQHLPLGPSILAHIDVLIAGRYVQTRRLAYGLRGSANKTVHLLTDRYTLEDIEQILPAEVIIDVAGDIAISGVDPPTIVSQ
jgi:anaerobic ribonucleoside-triphosphate reductase activating protein